MPRVALGLLISLGVVVAAAPARSNPSLDLDTVKFSLAAPEVQAIKLALGEISNDLALDELPNELALRLRWDKPQEWQGGLVRVQAKRNGRYLQADATVQVERGTKLILEAQAQCGCRSTRHKTALALEPKADFDARTVKIPIEIAVKGSSCNNEWSWWLVGFLGGGGLVFYLGSMFTHSRILSRREIARTLTPLQRQEDGSLQPMRRGRAEAHAQQALRHFRWHRRLLAWLRANPLVFGIPTKDYREVLRLELGPNSKTTYATVEGERDFLRRIESEPERYPGRLYAIASDTGRVRFRVIPAQGGKVGRLVMPRVAEQETEKWTPKVFDLRRTEDFVYELDDAGWQPGELAGWRVTTV